MTSRLRKSGGFDSRHLRQRLEKKPAMPGKDRKMDSYYWMMMQNLEADQADMFREMWRDSFYDDLLQASEPTWEEQETILAEEEELEWGRPRNYDDAPVDWEPY